MSKQTVATARRKARVRRAIKAVANAWFWEHEYLDQKVVVTSNAVSDEDMLKAKLGDQGYADKYGNLEGTTLTKALYADAKPLWEQQMSAGAVCMNLEHAAGAFGYASSWITDWYSYDAQATALFGLTDGEAVAGFIHIGTLNEPALERPRPDMAAKVTRLP